MHQADSSVPKSGDRTREENESIKIHTQKKINVETWVCGKYGILPVKRQKFAVLDT